MIKKISLFFVLSFSLITASLADEQHRVRLDDDKHSKETIECANFNIILELTDVKESGKVCMVLQGHYHKGNENIINNIPYITLPAMCEGEENSFLILEL